MWSVLLSVGTCGLCLSCDCVIFCSYTRVVFRKMHYAHRKDSHNARISHHQTSPSISPSTLSAPILACEQLAHHFVEGGQITEAGLNHREQPLPVVLEKALRLLGFEFGEGQCVGLTDEPDNQAIRRAAHLDKDKELHHTPQPLRIGLANDSQQLLAPAQEDGQPRKRGVDVILVDASPAARVEDVRSVNQNVQHTSQGW